MKNYKSKMLEKEIDNIRKKIEKILEKLCIEHNSNHKNLSYELEKKVSEKSLDDIVYKTDIYNFIKNAIICMYPESLFVKTCISTVSDKLERAFFISWFFWSERCNILSKSIIEIFSSFGNPNNHEIAELLLYLKLPFVPDHAQISNIKTMNFKLFKKWVQFIEKRNPFLLHKLFDDFENFDQDNLIHLFKKNIFPSDIQMFEMIKFGLYDALEFLHSKKFIIDIQKIEDYITENQILEKNHTCYRIARLFGSHTRNLNEKLQIFSVCNEQE